MTSPPGPHDLAARIEAHLLDAGDWVPVRSICALCGVPERRLRQLQDHPGLVSRVAISGDRGLKHVSLASPREWIAFKHRLRRHAIAQLVRVRDLGRRRRDVHALYRARHFERDTGQGILFQEAAP